MISYILRRVWQMVPTLLGVMLLIFFLFKFFGGDPVEIMAGLKSSPERIASLRAELGLDKPVLEQLWVFVQQVFTFNWGKSWSTNEAVSHIFATRLPATLTIMVPILLLQTGLAILAGLAVAYVRGSLTDRAIMIISTVALSVSFLVYIIVGQYVFGFVLGWFPVQGWTLASFSGRAG
jgi:peptide/nickel transport system permease protein